MKPITPIKEAGYEYIEGGVCAAAGFVANGCYCGLDRANPKDMAMETGTVQASRGAIAGNEALPGAQKKNDLALIYSERLCSAAAVYTTNKVKGAPILVTKKNLELTGGKAHAVIANSKNANTCNADGEEKARKMCALTAERLGVRPEEVIVASTGVIGQILPIEPIAAHMEELASDMRAEYHERAATAIMTTDTVKKETAVEFVIDGVTCHMGGMAKGSGMIHPNMATTLNFVTTDLAVSAPLLQKALSETVKVTYNCLSVDGDTSTNDMVCILANGAAGGAEITEENEAYARFKRALYLVLAHMTKMLAADGEGATKLLECTCVGAPDLETAITVAKSVIRSPLVKCAMFGEDANWGRVLCAVGYAQADFDIDKVDVDLASENGVLEVCRGGAGIPFSEEYASKILAADEIAINIHLNQGNVQAKAWGCDLSYDYVKINGDYRS